MCDRVPRYTSTNHEQKRTISDAEIVADLRRLFSALDCTQHHRSPVKTPIYSEACSSGVKLKDEGLLRHNRNVDTMLQCLGFTVERRPSTLDNGGTGVLVTGGTVPAGSVTSLYPGTTFCLLLQLHSFRWK